MSHKHVIYICGVSLILGLGCSQAKGPVSANAVNGSENTPLTIQDKSQLIGGPAAEGRVGDILMANDKIRVIIQKPGKYQGIQSFGGTIIDADRVRPAGEPGHDHFGTLVPLINIEWTVNALSMDVVSSGPNKPTIVRVNGVLDTFDYLDIDFIEPIAKQLTGTGLFYSPRFDDMDDPFTTTDLNQVDVNVTTEYRLDPGTNFVKITTTLNNHGESDVKMPVGDFVNGSGQVQLLIPGLGFAPDLIKQLPGDTPAVLYPGLPNTDVSYGYFYEFKEFLDPDQTVPTRLKSGSLSYSGVTGVLLGEEFPKVFPVGGGRDSQVNFILPAGQSRTMTRYFVVGDGSAGSLLDQGMQILKLPTHRVSGIVVNGRGDFVAGADVAILNADGNTIVTYRTDEEGQFSGQLSTGETPVSQAFGTGKYTVSVHVPGYAATDVSGASLHSSAVCTPDTVDMKKEDALGIRCVLGASGTLQFAGVTDAESGQFVPARLTIVGFDPSVDLDKTDRFFDHNIYDKPYGVADIQHFNAHGNLGLSESNMMRLAPGYYLLVFTRGPEYSMEVRPVTVTNGAVIPIQPVVLKHVVKTPGYISADFHVHGINSPDSTVLQENRVLETVAEGLDVLQSSDHDFLTDYAPAARDLAARGLISDNALQTIVGDEISPNNLGHIQAFPYWADPEESSGGALDWSYSDSDVVSPAPDYTMTVPQIMAEARKIHGPDKKIIQVNHIAETPLSIPIVTGWVTTTAYMDGFGVQPLSTFTDPVTQRMLAVNSPMPLPFGDSPMIGTEFDAVELIPGEAVIDHDMVQSAIPVWFNLLNLGILATATANSDTHTSYGLPVGLPRNYIASPVDPRDTAGDQYRNIDPEKYADPIRDHHLIISAGPFVTMAATGEDGGVAQVGDVVHGHQIQLHIEVTAPDWAWFDTIDIYANTEPLPADDDGVTPLKGAAANPRSFSASYHQPKYVYQPTQVYRLRDGTLKSWKKENGLITATLDLTINAKKDTWVVAYVHGTRETEGYKSLFPYSPNSVKDKKPAPLEGNFTLNDFYSHPDLDVPAWALTNPIFIDVDGDTNRDGHPFEALYVQQGISPVKMSQ